MPTRLMVILFIPMVTGLVFAGLRVADSVDNARQAADAERVAALARSATSLADALQNERDVSALPLTRGDRNAPAVRSARAATDRLVQKFNHDADRVTGSQRVADRVKTARTDLAALKQLRANAYRGDLMPLATELAYSEMWRPLLAFDNELGFGSSRVTSRGRAVYAISLAKASSSTKRVLVQTALARGHLDASEPVAIQAAQSLQTTADGEFLSGGLPQDVDLYNRTVTGSRLAPAAADLTRVLSVGPGKPLSASGVTPATWYRDSSVEISLMRKVELVTTDRIVADAHRIRDGAERDALVNGAAALVALALAGLLTFFTSRTMVRGMGVLRGSAMDVAENRLPELVENLSRTEPARVDTRVAPIPLFGRDEIGQVARAFDQVHREAVRLAAEQALLRGNVNAVFTNLSRRNQGLIERQLTLISDLETNETDPQQLENLFHLDHLATRMRRNDENLLVLAGEEPGRRWTRPVPLVDVVRAAAAEVEQYGRIELYNLPDTEINGAAVSDLVHLLAELLENATAFSSPHTKVRVDSVRLPDGRVMIEIHDKGIGLTPEDFADINHKLAHPPTVDVSVARRMGLFVVGRLAQRHGIKVRLRPSGQAAGTTSLVTLPEPVTHGAAPEPGGGEFEVSRIVPGPDPAALDTAAQEAGRHAAAELGFDDSRYTAQEGPPRPSEPGPPPAVRPLQRREPRATLGPAPDPGGSSDQSFDAFGTGQPGPRTAAGQGPPVPDQLGQAAAGQAQPGRDQTGQEPFARAPFDQDVFGPDIPAPAPHDAGEYRPNGYGPGAELEGRPESEYGPEPMNRPGRDPGPGGPDYAEELPVDFSGFLPPGSGNGTGPHPYGSGPLPPIAPPYTTPPPGSPGLGRDEYPDYAGAASGPEQPEQAAYAPGPDDDTPTYEGVGFTDSGLPRRPPPRQPDGEEPARESSEAASPAPDGAASAADGEWRSANDDKWRRAAQVRSPQAGGVTLSGLPRRVPRANLLPGTAEQTPQGGPKVSRAPDEVRGRLTKLRRGIQQGRDAGTTDTNGEGHGPDHQER